MPRQEVNDLFQQLLGRGPSQIEYEGFSKLLDAGTLDPLGLSMFIQGTPEFQQRQAPSLFRQFSQSLQEGGDQFLRVPLQQGFDQATSQFRRMGRPYSSGLESAFAQVGAQAALPLAQQRLGALSNLAGAYFGGIQPYQFGQAAGSRQRQFGLEDAFRQRAYDVSDYDRQQRDYERYLGMQMDAADRASRRSMWGQIGGGLLSGAGTALGGWLSK